MNTQSNASPASSKRPATTATRYLDLPRPGGGTGRIAYDDQGSGPLILLAPGMGMTRGTFRALTPLLLEAGYRVVTTDCRGLGESDLGWAEYSSAATAGDLIALLRHLDAGPALLYGCSYTAASAVHVLADTDARDLVRAVVLASPFVRDLPAPTMMASLSTKLITIPLLTRALWMAWFPHMYPRRGEWYKAFRDEVAANLREPGRTKAFAAMCAGTHSPAEAKLPRADSAVTGIPVLVVMGTADADFPDAAAEARFVGQTLNARVEMIEGSGHCPHQDAAPAIARLIIDLDSHR